MIREVMAMAPWCKWTIIDRKNVEATKSIAVVLQENRRLIIASCKENVLDFFRYYN